MFRRFDAEQFEDRRENVDAADRVADAPRRHRVVRRSNQERHVHGRLVDEEPVRPLAMFAEALAVIAHHHDDGVAREIVLVEVREQPADLRIDEGDLADVGAVRVARLEGLRRRVRRMRVVEVDPPEEARSGDLVEPRQRVIGYFIAGPIDAAERQRLIFRQVEVVEVGLKALRDPPLVIEYVGADEPAGGEAARLQPLGHRRLAVVEEEPSVVAHAVPRRELSREDRRVRRQRQRRRRDGLLEEHTFARQPIEVGRFDRAEPVGMDAVGARRVERDQQQVQVRRRYAGRKMAERLAVDGGYGARDVAHPCRITTHPAHDRQHRDGDGQP